MEPSAGKVNPNTDSEVSTMANPTAKDFGSSSATEQAKHQAGQAAEKTKEAAHIAGDKAKEAASGVGAKAKEAAQAIGGMVSSAASAAGTAAGNAAERATTAAGSGVRHLGETIKEKGPQSGVFGSATRAVGNTLQEGGQYLEQEGFSGMMDDVAELVRRNPLPAVLVGVGLGFLLGRMLGS